MLLLFKNKLYTRNFKLGRETANIFSHKSPALKSKNRLFQIHHYFGFNARSNPCHPCHTCHSHLNYYAQLINSKEEISLKKNEYEQFVMHFKQASHYIVGHQAKTFVIVIPGEVLIKDEMILDVLESIQLLHGLGVRLVIIASTSSLIDRKLKSKNIESKFIGNIRITNEEIMDVVIEQAGLVRVIIEGFFSKSLSMPMIRRHIQSDGNLSINTGIKIISGNFVASKRIGVIGGIDFGYAANVKYVRSEEINIQLQNQNIVLLTNLGYNAAGEILNCNSIDVGLHTAVLLKADKLFCLHMHSSDILKLPTWLPLHEAFLLINKNENENINLDGTDLTNRDTMSPSQISMVLNTEIDKFGYAIIDCMPLFHSILACSHGVKRAHLVDATVKGSLLLELYTRDGIGTMISSDLHEGIRHAVAGDLNQILNLLTPLQKLGIVVQKTSDEILAEISTFRVFEKEGNVLGCASLKDINTNDNKTVEIASFCIHPDFRGHGKGDALLQYVEQELLSRGVSKIVILTTRTADWFVQRGFEYVGLAHESLILPKSRKDKIDKKRNSQLYLKYI